MAGRCLGSASRVRGEVGEGVLMRPCPAPWAPEASSSSRLPAPTGLRDPGHLPSPGCRPSPHSQRPPRNMELVCVSCRLSPWPSAPGWHALWSVSLPRQPGHSALLCSSPTQSLGRAPRPTLRSAASGRSLGLPGCPTRIGPLTPRLPVRSGIGKTTGPDCRTDWARSGGWSRGPGNADLDQGGTQAPGGLPAAPPRHRRTFVPSPTGHSHTHTHVLLPLDCGAARGAESGDASPGSQPARV